MGNKNSCQLYENIKRTIESIYNSMDDYLYVQDLSSGMYYVAPSVLERFDLPANEFGNSDEVFKAIVHPEDYPTVVKDVSVVASGDKLEHDMTYRWRGKDGTYKWVNCRGNTYFDGDIPVIMGCINEIGRHQVADNTSGLLGEKQFQEFYEKGIADGNAKGYIIRFGIDDFKEINESHGFDYGDTVIRKTAERIQKVVGKKKIVYRLRADEYIMVCFGDYEISDAIDVYEKVADSIENFLEESNYDVFYTMSAGIIDMGDLGEKNGFERILRISEYALNEAKHRGKNQYYILCIDDYDKFKERRKMINLMKKVVTDGCKGFEAFFQPIADYKTKKFVGAETLLRYRDEDGNLIPPYKIIPVLEETGLIIPVGRFIMEEAMKMCKTMKSIIPGFYVTVNISYIQVNKSNVLEDIIAGVKKYKLPAGTFVVELTESGFIESNESFIAFANALRKNGVLLALDDFGTGYSNLHYLYNLRPDTMKIDRSFTMQALESPYEMLILNYLADMAHSMDLKMVIEGIEEAVELERIGQIKPDYIQGYYFGKPMPTVEFLEAVEKN